MMCRCDLDCSIPIYWMDDMSDVQLPICNFVASILTSCNLPNMTGYEKVDGDRIWNLALAWRKKKVEGARHYNSDPDDFDEPFGDLMLY